MNGDQNDRIGAGEGGTVGGGLRILQGVGEKPTLLGEKKQKEGIKARQSKRRDGFDVCRGGHRTREGGDGGGAKGWAKTLGRGPPPEN